MQTFIEDASPPLWHRLSAVQDGRCPAGPCVMHRDMRCSFRAGRCAGSRRAVSSGIPLHFLRVAGLSCLHIRHYPL